LERLDAIENTLEVHPAVAPGEGLSQQPHLYRMTPQDASFSPWSARRAMLPGGEPPPHPGFAAREGTREGGGRMARRRALVDADPSELERR
ncbi:MAG: hypothetical protein NT171_11335, partial [Planctomycetota bacterium]|nr:hypothetical protein [Planctomycetota bacterium]